MSSLFGETLGLLSTVFSAVVAVFTSLLSWGWSVLLIVHNDFPRLEGLIVGILFAWFLMHRDKHPYLRALAAPLKIILDTLDIIWTETGEAFQDLVGDVKEKISKLLGVVKGGLRSAYDKVISSLTRFKNAVSEKLNRKKE